MSNFETMPGGDTKLSPEQALAALDEQTRLIVAEEASHPLHETLEILQQLDSPQ
ncbi:MAG: hypothetical protein U9M92_03100 [Patescibacteria group bacterium]|nr:hypothetical protein [Patescibacteria group bacterium]